jgi:hypothetical protein
MVIVPRLGDFVTCKERQWSRLLLDWGVHTFSSGARLKSLLAGVLPGIHLRGRKRLEI